LVIARAIAGNDAAFVSQMNDDAANLGLTESHFMNPIALDADGQLASPYDMIVVARAAMRFPFFRKVVATPHIVINGHWSYDLTNTNYFLGRRPDVVGVKTGTTDQALHAITVADDVGGHLLYVTVMHSPDYVPDVTALLTYTRDNYQSTPLDLPISPLVPVSPNAAPKTLAVASDYQPFLGRWAA